MNFPIAILILKMEENTHFRHIMHFRHFITSRKVKMQLKGKKRFVQYMEVLWLIERVTSGLWSLELEIPRCSVLHSRASSWWRSNRDIENNQYSPTRERADILKISKSILSYCWKWKILFYGKKYELFGQPNSYCHFINCFLIVFVVLCSFHIFLPSSFVCWWLSVVLCLNSFIFISGVSLADFWFVVTMCFIYTKLRL